MSSYCQSIAILSLALAACGSDAISLETSQAPGSADGETLVEVTAQVTVLGTNAEDGATVWFRADEALLFESPEAAEPEVVGGLVTGQREVSVPILGGIARILVRAPTSEQVISVEAGTRGEDGASITGRLDLSFARPPPVSSGTLLIGDQATPQFILECEHRRLGGFVVDRPDIFASCAVITRALDDSLLHHVPIKLYAEAGELIEVPATVSNRRSFFYRIPRLLERRPVDVRPLSGEQAFSVPGAELTPSAIEQNPRDGLVTILVVTRGHEAFSDLNGNGIWDENEPFLDEGEPFLDNDDDGLWDPTIDGPHCCDTNGNGVVDGPNGAWDGDAFLGRTNHILWTGAAKLGEGRSAMTPADLAIPAGMTGEVSLTLVDANFNPVSLNGSTDSIGVALEGPVQLDSETSFELDRGVGIAINDRYPDFRFDGASVAGDAAPILEEVRTYPLVLEDLRASEGCVAETWEISAEVFATPSDNAAMPQSREVLATSGTLEACVAARSSK